MAKEVIIKSPEVSFCCGAIEYFQNQVMLSGYTIEMTLMIKGKSEDVKYPNIDTWEMEKALKEIRNECMDKLLVPKNMKQINIKDQKENLVIKSDDISLTLPKKRAVLLNCENFMMDEVAISFLKSIAKKFPDKKIGMKITHGKPVGEIEVWL
jgi:hypothetical protein